jgi:hypothetical protein
MFVYELDDYGSIPIMICLGECQQVYYVDTGGCFERGKAI